MFLQQNVIGKGGPMDKGKGMPFDGKGLPMDMMKGGPFGGPMMKGGPMDKDMGELFIYLF